MTDEQRTALALHLDAYGLHFAANAVRSRYDDPEIRDGGCGCTIAILAPCEQHQAKVAA